MAVISVKLRVLIQEELEMDIQRVYHWPDSTSVLKCIFNVSKRFHSFESNRLTIIHSRSSPTEWRYVDTGANPAEDGTKGVKLEDLKKNDRWLKGSRFLWQEESEWPAMIEVPQLTDDDPEVRNYHEDVGHMGQETVLAKLRSRFWIVKGRSTVRRIIRKCRGCVRRNVRLREQHMANLPHDRVTPDKPPFTNGGIDYLTSVHPK